MTPSAKAFCTVMLFAKLLGACGDDGGPGTAGTGGDACLPALDLECLPSYPPTFDQIYERRIEPTCSVAPCHASGSNAGNLTLGDADASYQTLLEQRSGAALVIPGDPECSVLIQRLESDDLDFVMPSRSPLSEGERCAIRQWVANGAER